ncbi:hypothetical protein GCM10011515_15610 [Tsuneonella deserti]|uniref:PepSY-associated TM helix n=1 Tax=Tsuneonella deserti TaxID=2035528 RepID=A0ABQ1SAH5_9SPHN|nr:hypothetical protein [Tsuneonella deserti]GGD96652.1 hypothetical protein GCM10011515_15610 [Tsuneonella deserti]
MHKWLALAIGVQAVIWTLSGLYMTVVHIDTIHGDHLVRSALPAPTSARDLASPIAAAAALPGATSVRLTRVLERPIYVVTTGQGEYRFDAQTARPLPPPTQDEIRRAAEYWFTGPGQLSTIALIDQIPSELRGRKPPLWRVDFEGWNQPTLYFAPSTGELVSRRHELWRVFDFLWMMHIMDYETRDNVNNLLLRAFTLAALATGAFGVWLLWFAFSRPRRKARAR